MDYFDIGLLTKDTVPVGYTRDFIDELSQSRVRLRTETHPEGAYASLEWAIPTAIAVYVSKPFIDAFLKRAADDVADVGYPVAKKAITNLVRRIFVREPVLMTIVATSPSKVHDPSCLAFAMHSKTKDDQNLKFVFRGQLTEAEYDISVEALFVLLQSHFSTVTHDDELSRQIQLLRNPRTRHVYIIYSPETGWTAADLSSQESITITNHE